MVDSSLPDNNSVCFVLMFLFSFVFLIQFLINVICTVMQYSMYVHLVIF